MMGEERPETGLLQRVESVLEEHQSISQAEDPPALARCVYAALRRLLDPAGMGIFLRDEKGALRLLGPEPAPATSAAPLDALLEEWGEPVLECLKTGETIQGAGADGGTLQVASPLPMGEGVGGALEVRAQPERAFRPQEVLCIRMLACCVGSTLHQIRIRESLRSDRERLETLVESSADAIITTDERGCITLFSPGAEEIFGYRAEEVLGTPVEGYYYRGRREAERVMERLRARGKVKNYETWFRSKAGRGVPASLSSSLLHDRRGNMVGTLGILKDITHQKEMEEKLNYTIERLQEANEQLEVLAVTDNLSGLYNHRTFIQELEEEVERSIRTRRPLSVLMIDIDKFKDFNDTYGHQVGDRIIEEIGRVIQRSIRRVDTGCRYGGEEFTVILPETGGEDAGIVADRIRLSFRRSSLFGQLRTHPATLSVGVATYDPRQGRVPPAEIVRAADQAMYRVKRRGGDRVGLGSVHELDLGPAGPAPDDAGLPEPEPATDSGGGEGGGGAGDGSAGNPSR